MSQITVVGSLNMDLVVRTPRVPVLGETIKGHDFRVIPGGKGANQAVAAARLGARVTMIGRVGDDDFGRQQQRCLRQDGVDLSRLIVDPAQSTGVALITVDDRGQNNIVIVAGANGQVTPRQIDDAQDAITQADLLVCQFETPLDAITRAIEIAAAHDVPVVLNPAPAYPCDATLLQKVTYLIPNESEASFLTGCDVHDPDSARQAAAQLQQFGAATVIVTLGANGVLIAQAGEFTHEPSVRVNAVDSTAAGDAFVGGFAVALTEGKAVREAVRWAKHVAALSVTKIGAQSSLPIRADVEQFIAGS